MGHSINIYPYEGTDIFDLNFTAGYTSRTDVACFLNDEEGTSVPFTFLTDNQVEIDATGITLGEDIVFTRTVDKTALPIDYRQPGKATREALQTNSLHALYIMHEVLDGRVSSATLITDAVFENVDGAVETALASFLFRAQFIQDIVLRPSFTSAEIATYTSGDLSCDAEDVAVYVETNPAVPVEVLVKSGGQVVYSVSIAANGDLTPSTTLVNFSAGAVEVEITGGNYVSGLEAAIVFPCFRAVDVDFGSQAVPDLSQQLEDEVNA